jgi:hypothetical protein
VRLEQLGLLTLSFLLQQVLLVLLLQPQQKQRQVALQLREQVFVRHFAGQQALPVAQALQAQLVLLAFQEQQEQQALQELLPPLPPEPR